MSSGRIALAAPYPPPLRGMAHQANILANYFEGEGVEVHRIRTNNHGNRLPFRDISALRQFAAVRNRIDALNIHACCYTSYFGTVVPLIWWAKKRGIRTVVTYKGGDAREVFNRLGEAGLRWLRKADVVTVQSGFLKGVFADFGLETQVVNNLYESTVETETPHTPRTDAPRLVMTRGLGHYYNVETTVRAFKIVLEKYPNAQLLLAGRGNREKQIRDEVARLNLPNVTFMGHLQRDQIHELYRSGDIFVSSSAVDNFPGAHLEAFLFGVPIATTNAGGIPFMVEHGVSARMVEIDDYEALGREIVYLLDHPDEAREMAAAAQKNIQNYRWPAVRDRWFEVLGLKS